MKERERERPTWHGVGKSRTLCTWCMTDEESDQTFRVTVHATKVMTLATMPEAAAAGR